MAAIIQIVVSPFGFTANDVGPIAVESDHADDYVAAVVAALEGIDFSNLSNITVSGSEGGLVVLSHDGTPLRPIIWASDTTSQAGGRISRICCFSIPILACPRAPSRGYCRLGVR